ncbi:MAG: HAD-IB family phosphatase [Candidatus Marinimicrobia bacterium]|nr:HAD-IB family phosphatase [Candidatus Neomarinimicrobiota bacterium]MCF7828941.1 HAD-IB family phosphatase [Candidatus Neomarinimicrobiota bacterium]MCF7879901.1 HAD-IB family phosphatase [Candidatus Neomarinimicrobiota bacterium]
MDKIQFSSIIFDFDNTLTGIEGVEYLAEIHGVGDEIRDMVDKTLNTYTVSPAMYEQRLDLIQPTREDVTSLAGEYKKHLLPGVKETVESLAKMGKSMYIISGGVRKAIVPVGEYLGIPAANVHAVDVYFDLEGDYIGFDKDSSLVTSAGKQQMIRTIAPEKPVVFIGDGANDIAVQDEVDRFIGFGGAEYRPPIEKACEYYVKEENFQSVLQYILTTEEYNTIEQNN